MPVEASDIVQDAMDSGATTSTGCEQAGLRSDERVLIPVGESEQQLLQLVHRHADGTTSVRTLEGCRFVP